MAGKKKNPNARYAFIGLIVALIACIATGLLGSTQFLTKGIGMFSLADDIQNGVTLALQISIGLIIVGLAAYALLDPDSIRRFLTGRQARYGSNSLILTLAFVGILIAVNYIVYKNPNLLKAPWDMTSDLSNTLAPETLQILATLPDNVTATAFYTAELNRTSAEELLQKFKNNSNGKFDFTFVNPDLDPVAAKEAGVTGDGKIMLQMGDAKEIADFASENALGQAMIRLISGESRVVYFLQGHGEIPLEPGGELAFNTVVTVLEEKNYTVNVLNLLTDRKVPEDAEAIIIVGPKKPVSEDEVALLKAYVDGGGSLIVLEDPLFFTEFGNAKDPLNEYLTSDWGITLNDDVVIDGVNTQNPFAAISSNINYGHPITQLMTSNLSVIMPQARSITIGESKENVTQTWLVGTTENSWGESDIESSDGPAFDPAADVQGPLYLAVAGENTVTKGRVVVVGNSLFAIDGNFDFYGNGNFIINSIDWAAEQEDILNLTTRPRTERTFVAPNATWQFVLIVIVLSLVIPGMVVFFGISAWIARRKRG